MPPLIKYYFCIKAIKSGFSLFSVWFSVGFGFVFRPCVLEFYGHKSFTPQMDDSNKSTHRHGDLDAAHAVLSHEHTLLIRNGGHRLPLSFGLTGCTN